jgi:dTMP kinase
MKGLFVTMEGVEGSGKSTQIALLKDYLQTKGRSVDVTREPGGTPIGEAVRTVLLDPANDMMDSMSELLLYEAARAQHVAQIIRPALDRGTIIICDRFSDSTTAYQGAGRGLSKEEMDRLHGLATRGLVPDLTILIDLPVAEGLARAKRYRDADRIELEPEEFHERVRQAFLRLAKDEPDRVKIVDGLLPMDKVAEEIRSHTEAMLSRSAYV